MEAVNRWYAAGQDPERSATDAYIIPAFRGEQTFMPTSFLEIVELPDGRIELRRAEDEGSLVTLDFSEDAKVFLQGQRFDNLGEAERGYKRNQYLGFVYQFHHLLPEFSALENVAMPLMLRSESNFKDVKKQVEYLLDRVGLSHRMDHKPGELSGGERQRVALARALVTKPAVVLADEPTGNLDRKTALSIFELLTDLKKELNMAMLIVTHDEQLAQSADSILHMQDGLWIDPK